MNDTNVPMFRVHIKNWQPISQSMTIDEFSDLLIEDELDTELPVEYAE